MVRPSPSPGPSSVPSPPLLVSSSSSSLLLLLLLGRVVVAVSTQEDKREQVSTISTRGLLLADKALS